MSKAQDAFLARRYGIFNHYLYGNPSDDAELLNRHAPKDWNELTESVDVEDLARRVYETGAGYYCITLMQGSRHMLAPNGTYDRIAGTQPGEACARRDLPMELADALAVYDIDLFLYYTGDGPHLDPVIGSKFGYADPRGQVTEDFVDRWSAVLREYAVRYGSKVKGWWIDGLYRTHFGYTDELMKPYYEACKTGNPDCLVAMNNGLSNGYGFNYPEEDFICGEFNDFVCLPENRFSGKAQSHILAPLGKPPADNPNLGWRKPGCRHDAAYMADFIRRAEGICPVTIDIFVDEHGNWDPEQLELLREVKTLLSGKHN